MRNVAILLFEHVEVLDFAGPFEVFSVCGRRGSDVPFNVFTVAETETVNARNNLKITPAYLLEDCPFADIIIIPGGGGTDTEGKPFGSRKEMDNPIVLNWIKERNVKAEYLLSVCTGSMILAKTGLLDGLKATTHWKAVEAMQSVAPHTQVMAEERWVDNGRIILSAGISAGIDMSFYVISKILGKEAARETAKYMQYDYWQ